MSKKANIKSLLTAMILGLGLPACDVEVEDGWAADNERGNCDGNGGGNSSGDGYCLVYKEKHFQGDERMFEEGEEMKHLNGGWNDKIRSLKCYDGARFRGWTGHDFKGSSFTSKRENDVTNDYSAPDWNGNHDGITSFKIL